MLHLHLLIPRGMREENEERPEPVGCFMARMRLGVVYGGEKGERRLET